MSFTGTKELQRSSLPMQYLIKVKIYTTKINFLLTIHEKFSSFNSDSRSCTNVSLVTNIDPNQIIPLSCMTTLSLTTSTLNSDKIIKCLFNTRLFSQPIYYVNTQKTNPILKYESYNYLLTTIKPSVELLKTSGIGKVLKIGVTTCVFVMVWILTFPNGFTMKFLSVTYLEINNPLNGDTCLILNFQYFHYETYNLFVYLKSSILNEVTYPVYPSDKILMLSY